MNVLERYPLQDRTADRDGGISYGCHARNARALTLYNLRFETSTPDLRPAMVLQNVEDVSITGMTIAVDARVESALRLIDTRQASITSPRLLSAAKVFLQIEGTKSAEVRISDGDIRRAAERFAFRDGARTNAADGGSGPA